MEGVVMETRRVDIQNGPDRYELERALFDGKPMTFTCRDSCDCEGLIVDAMKCADERRNGEWVLEGHRPKFTEYGSSVNPYTFVAQYHVGKRKGKIEIFYPPETR